MGPCRPSLYASAVQCARGRGAPAERKGPGQLEGAMHSVLLEALPRCVRGSSDLTRACKASLCLSVGEYKGALTPHQRLQGTPFPSGHHARNPSPWRAWGPSRLTRLCKGPLAPQGRMQGTPLSFTRACKRPFTPHQRVQGPLLPSGYHVKEPHQDMQEAPFPSPEGTRGPLLLRAPCREPLCLSPGHAMGPSPLNIGYKGPHSQHSVQGAPLPSRECKEPLCLFFEDVEMASK